MGRRATGVDFTTSAPRLELSALLRVGYFAKEATCSGGWSWSNGDRAEITTHRVGINCYMDITTRWKDYTGQAYEQRQRIYLFRKPSNLGRGEVLYFRCPFTHRLCRILYRAYHSNTWRSRTAFCYRLYYPQQTEPAWGRTLCRENSAERKLDRLYSMRATSTYMGRPTRRALRIAKLVNEIERLAAYMWHPSSLPPNLARAVLQGFDPEEQFGWKRKA
jgi:hypothetical protein